MFLRHRFFLPPHRLTTTQTPLTGIRLNPCATPLWGGPSGLLADPTPNAVPFQEEITMCSLVVRKIPILKYVTRLEQHESGVGQKNLRSALMGLHLQLWRLDHGRSQSSERGKRVEMRTRRRSDRPRQFHELDSGIIR